MSLDPSHGLIKVKTAYENLIAEVSVLDKKHAASNPARRIGRRLQPLIDFVERYAIAIDVAVQGTLSPATLVWGALRGLLVAAGSFSRYFDRLGIALEKLGLVISVYSRYESIIRGGGVFHAALSLVYTDIIHFLERAKKVFRRSSLVVLARNLWQDFETEFKGTLSALSQHTEALREEATLAYRIQLQNSVTTQNNMMATVLDGLITADVQHRRSGLLEWLAPVDTQQDFRRESGKRLKQDGSWFVASREFDSWLQHSEKLLWAFGPPSSGKTVLSTTAIEHIQSHTVHKRFLAFFYYDRSDAAKMSSLAMVSSLLSQLLSQSEVIPAAVTAAYEKSKILSRSTISLADSPFELLRYVINELTWTHIVIDGLDESTDFLCSISEFMNLQRSVSNVSLLIFSRDIPSIRSRLSSSLSIELSITNTKDDIESYIFEAVKSFQLADTEPELETRIISQLRSNAQGMFLWVHLMITNLKSATTPSEISSILGSLPFGLNAAYEQSLGILSGETTSRRDLARKVISWTCFSCRPLTWPELQCALSVNHETMAYEPDRRPFLKIVLELCSAFIVYDPPSNTIRPVHASVCEYFTNDPGSNTADLRIRETLAYIAISHRHIGLCCMAYLSMVWNVKQADDNLYLLPLTEYATLSWLDHILQSTYESKVDRMLVGFLSSPRRRKWIVHFLLDHRAILPLHRLFHIRSRLLLWSQLYHDATTATYLDWVIDVSTILLDLDEKRICIPFKTGQVDEVSALGGTDVNYFERMMIVRDLSRQFTHSGRLQSGIGLFESALVARQSVYGHTSLKTSWLLNTLGIMYDEAQQLCRAVATQEKALGIQRETLGSEHSEPVWTETELGRIYRHQERLDDAERAHANALRILCSTRTDPGSDPEVAWTLSTLARVYRKQKRYDEALSMSTQALKVRRKLLGGEHPHCLWLLGDIAQCYFEIGDLTKAAEYHRQALQGRKVVLVSEHQDTLWTMNSLGIVLAASGEEGWHEARGLQLRAYEIQKRVLGAEHPHTQWTKAVLSDLVDLMG